MRPPLLNQAKSMSDTLYIRGLSRRITDDELTRQVLNQVETPVELDLISKRQAGVIWARYSSIAIAQRTIMKIHQSIWYGVSMNVKFEMGFDEKGERIVARNSHNTVIRSVSYRKGYAPCVKDCKKTEKNMIESAQQAACYTSKSLLLGKMEYPFPTGLYLSRVVQMMRDMAIGNPLLQMLTDPCLGNKYGKEMSEIMGMTDATERAIKLVIGEEPRALRRVIVYALGEGKRPLCAATICLHMPDWWRYVSIDPLLEIDDLGLGDYGDRFRLFRGKSQDFDLEDTEYTQSFSDSTGDEITGDNISEPISIVVALHSHAPLAEFWARLRGSKIAITMECCAEYSELYSVGQTPILEYDDFEVYSPKRRVKIYSSMQTSFVSQHCHKNSTTPQCSEYKAIGNSFNTNKRKSPVHLCGDNRSYGTGKVCKINSRDA